MMSTHTPSHQVLLENSALLDIVIGKLLGRGLCYDEWKRELERLRGFTWSESLKNIIIKKEFNFFREEILRLQSEPNIACGLKSKTNSLESILKRLQGLEWAKGIPDEMEKRKRDGRLLGKDAKARCLQYHVARWKTEAALASQQSSTTIIGSKYPEPMPNAEDTQLSTPNITHTMMPAALFTSASKNQIKSYSSDNKTCLGGDSFSFRKPLHISNSNMPSMLRCNASLPECDPTLSRDYEIPWVPQNTSQEIESHVADITFEDFFSFVEQNPDFPIEAPSTEPSFELPCRYGINESYRTYISRASQNSNTQRTIIEGILDSYGSQPSKEIWFESLSQANTGASSNSQFKQQQNSAWVATSSEQSFGISPQDLMYDGCRSDKDTDHLHHSIDTEALAFGNKSSSGNSEVEGQETNMGLPQDQNHPVTLAPGMAKISSPRFHGSARYSGAVPDPPNDSLYHIRTELHKKRDELVAAQNTVSKLATEIKLLEEFANRGSRRVEGIPFEDTFKQKSSHKRGNDEILHGARRCKKRAIALNFNSDISIYPNNTKSQETLPPTANRFPFPKDPAPRTIPDAGGRVPQFFNQNINETASECSTIPAVSTSEPPKSFLSQAKPNNVQYLSRTFNDTSPLVSLHADRVLLFNQCRC